MVQQNTQNQNLTPNYIHIKVSSNNSYVGQTGKSLGIRHKEHTRYKKKQTTLFQLTPYTY